MRRAVILVFFLLFGLSCYGRERRCEAQKLVQEEVNVLEKISQKLKKQWDFSLDPCDESWSTWVVPVDDNTTPSACSCNGTICHMTTIRLRGLSLAGELPSELANLTQLSNLDLTANFLNGSIPAAWASLPLNSLHLGGNRISGTIPDELGNMSTLQSLILEDNQMEGKIPATLGKLTNLKELFLTANNFSGELPDSLANLKNMTDMIIDGNPISGKIPYFLGNWTQLQRLDMQGTSLEGPFPPNFANLRNITELRVSDLKKGGEKFPPLRNLKGLRKLVLRNLSISGFLPAYVGHLPLKVLDLSFNKLRGKVPSSFDNLQHSIDYMYLTHNMLQGTIPSWTLNNKDYLDLSYNNFTGPLDSPNCQQENGNFFSSYSSTYNNTIETCLRRNLHCSEKPRNYNFSINCGDRKVIIGDREYEADSLPSEKSTYTGQTKWASSSTGAFLDNEKALHVAKSALVLNMSNPELYTRARLSPLSLKYHGLCLQKGDYAVNLHFAEIMFTDDQTFSSVGRRLFDVSIQGEKVLQDFDIAKEANGTGKEIIKNFNASVDDTLEIHFYWAGKGTHSVPYKGVYGPLISAISVTPNFVPEIYDQVDTSDHKLSVGAIFGIVAASCVAILFILVGVGFWICWRRKHGEHNEFGWLKLQTSTFSLKQIKTATNSFHPLNKIGEGGFGPVYKGVLQDGLPIAVKQLSSRSKQGNREFVNEIGLISALQHPNLVKLLGCCIEGNQLLLIYEYMENNSLARALFGPENDRLKLDWQTKRKICLGIAKGLVYLHEESRLKIVHRDIKATNILLDKDLNAKISDFGVAKLDEGNTHISTRIAGTVGYMAPEYAMRGYLTDKADVYSFGVVMLEIISGKSNTNYRPREDFTYLLDWAFVLEEQGRLTELIDPNLSSKYSKEEALQMLTLCLMCTNQSLTLRPSMSTVVRILEGKIPVQVSSNNRANLKEDARFKSFENLSYNSETGSMPIDMQCTESFISVQSINRQTPYSSSSKFLSDYSESSTTDAEE